MVCLTFLNCTIPLCQYIRHKIRNPSLLNQGRLILKRKFTYGNGSGCDVHCGVCSLQRAKILFENCEPLYSSAEQGLSQKHPVHEMVPFCERGERGGDLQMIVEQGDYWPSNRVLASTLRLNPFSITELSGDVAPSGPACLQVQWLCSRSFRQASDHSGVTRG